jgi:hypothetical protein
MELREALLQIDVIHRQMARTEKFRGYGAASTACGSLLALIAATIQIWFIPQPADDLRSYLALWVGTAIVAGFISGGDAWRRHLRDAHASGALIRLACEQFLPCVVAGAALTAVVARYAPTAAWMLPGLWAILFSLGLFASLRLLPGATIVPALWYLLGGCLIIAIGPERGGFAPWTMLVTFGVGQLALAAILATQTSDKPDAEANDAS